MPSRDYNTAPDANAPTEHLDERPTEYMPSDAPTEYRAPHYRDARYDAARRDAGTAHARDDAYADTAADPNYQALHEQHRRAVEARGLKIAQIVYLLFGILEALLAIRFVLRLLAANPHAGFSSLIYGITQPFVAPFQGVFTDPVTGNVVLELSTLLAIIVYALLAWAIVKVLTIAVRRQPPAMV